MQCGQPARILSTVGVPEKAHLAALPGGWRNDHERAWKTKYTPARQEGSKTMFSKLRNLHARTLLIVGGLVASLVLLGFGAASIVIGIQGRNEVNSTLAAEHIVAPADSTIPGQTVYTGAEAKAMADVMRKHTLESSKGLTYAQMGRYKIASGAPAGTNDVKLAVKDANGNPVSNPVRDLWVTETALTTALNTSYFASQVGLFAIVMGVALVLTGIGFSVLTLGTLARHSEQEEKADEAAAIRAAAPGGKISPSGAK